MSFIRNYPFIVPLPVLCQTEVCYTVDHSKHTLPYPNSTVPNQNIPSHVMRFSTLSPEPTWALLNRILGRASFAFFYLENIHHDHQLRSRTPRCGLLTADFDD